MASTSAVYFFLLSSDKEIENAVGKETVMARHEVCGERPCNVILIVSDTLSAKNMSLYGYKQNTTPFLNKLADESALVFHNSMSAAGWTPPSMSALFNSKSPHKISYSEIASAENSFIKELQQYDVDVVGFVKTFETELSDSIVIQSVNNNFIRHDAEYYTHDYYTAGGSDFAAAAKWINDRKKEEPYFLFLHDTTVHDPYDPPTEFRKFFNESGLEISYPIEFDSPMESTGVSVSEGEKHRIAYDQEVLYLDSLLEKFVTDIGDLENTIIIFTSDHGETFGDISGRGQHARPTEVSSVYSSEQILHVPLVVFGGPIERGVSNCLVGTTDIAPTILNIFGIPVPEQYLGISFLESECQKQIIYSDQSKTDMRLLPTIMNFNILSESVSQRMIFEHVPDTIIAARDVRWKVMENGLGLLKVYDLESDPEESQNLASKINELSNADQDKIAKIREVIRKVSSE